MGRLAGYLQEEFERLCPEGWHIHREHAFVQPEFSGLLGFSPRADLFIQKTDGSRKLWVELEISRADPAANQIKFAAAHLFDPFAATDFFVSMVSAHVAPGRRSLGAQAVLILRRLGLRAQQTSLLPAVARSEIQRINHLPMEKIRLEELDVSAELERVFAVTEQQAEGENGALYLAGNEVEVRLNLLRWNREMCGEAGGRCWGQRTITYFVFDPTTGLFAPSKFCAYVMMNGAAAKAQDNNLWPGGMDLAAYSTIPANAPLFDGGRARRHLVERLGLRSYPACGDTALKQRFNHWLTALDGSVVVHPKGPSFIRLPER